MVWLCSLLPDSSIANDGGSQSTRGEGSTKELHAYGLPEAGRRRDFSLRLGA